MKLLQVEPGPHFSVADVARGWLKGFNQNGIDARPLPLDRFLDFYDLAHIDKGRGLEKALSAEEAVRAASKQVETFCYEWWPDVVVIVSGFFVYPDIYPLLRARGHKLVLLCTESPYEDPKQLERAPLFDLVILNDPTNIEQFREVNPNTYYIGHAYDPDVHFPQPAKPNCVSDFAFVGTGYPSRVSFLEAIDWTGMDVALAGNWQELRQDSPLRPFLTHPIEFCCDNSEAVDLYNGTKMSANIYRTETIPGGDSKGWAMGPRELELAACGTFFLREPRGEGDEVFPMVPTFSDEVEFQALLRWYLAHDDDRAEIAKRARKAIADRTFKNNTAEVLRHLERI